MADQAAAPSGNPFADFAAQKFGKGGAASGDTSSSHVTITPMPASAVPQVAPQPVAASPQAPQLQSTAGDALAPVTGLSPQAPAPAPTTNDAWLTPGTAEAQRTAGGAPEAPAQDPLTPVDVGVTQAAYGLRDFFAGVPPENERSSFRQNADQAQAGFDGAQNFVSNVTQFSVGMLGAGKFADGLSLIPKVGEALSAATAALGSTVTTSLKAAGVGSVFFDPHAQNFANVVQSFPVLANPLTQFLASDPSDSTAWGRVKNAMTSLGFDAAVTNTVKGAMHLYRARLSGNTVAIQAAEGEAATALREHQQPPQAAEAGPAVDMESLAQAAKGPSRDTIHVASPKKGRPAPLIPAQLSDDTIASISKHSAKDTDALMKYGSWDAAIQAGHTFGGEDHIPWQLIGGTNTMQAETSLDAFTARVADSLGRRTITDADQAYAVQRYAWAYNQDPLKIIGQLQAAGRQSNELRAQMEAGFLVSERLMQDAWTLDARIAAGDLTEFGGDQAKAQEALKHTIELAATAVGAANSVLANAGRTLRGARREFKLSPDQVRALHSMDPALLHDALQATQGDPRAIKKVLAPGLWQRIGDWSQFLLINNLISNPKTHFTIFLTNLYQVASRPAERYVGATVQRGIAAVKGDPVAAERAQDIQHEAMRQYTYIATSLNASFKMAVKAFQKADSIIAPHNVEQVGSHGVGADIAAANFKPLDSVPNALWNVGLATAKGVGMPSRLVAAQDELVKQVVYQSKVQANAYVDGQRLQLRGPELTAYVQKRLFEAFDDYGRATDQGALNEAKIATYQQDIPETGNFGMQTFSTTVQRAVNNYPPLKIALPFVKTPANLFRNGVALTPGLNMLQKEYRESIQGLYGPERQAQAIGQMATGGLFMGVAAYLAMNGMVTGSGPSDPRLRRQNIDNGYQENSFVLRWKDGSVSYIPFGRYDPIAMPFSAMADAVDVAMSPEPADARKAQNMAAAIFTGMMKNMTDKLYLANLAQILEALEDPDANIEHPSKVSKTAGKMVANYVPFSSLLRQFNTDPYMRDARDFVSQIKGTVPGFSQDVPARYDFTGTPVTVRKGLWWTKDNSHLDDEVNRMANQQDVAVGPPPARAQGGTDLRQITMATGENAYDKLQQLSGQPAKGMQTLRATLEKLVQTPAYQAAPDGSGETKGTKMSFILDVVRKYRESAGKILRADPNVLAAETADRKRVGAAYSAQSPNPTQANKTSQALDNIGATFGVDLKPMLGAAMQQNQQPPSAAAQIAAPPPGAPNP